MKKAIGDYSMPGIIGEAVNHLSPEAQKELPGVQLRLIRGMRNRLAHDYRNVSIRIVWETIGSDIVPLVQTLQSRPIKPD
jgi:uncharacterized protein with HEPN domain